MTTLEEEDVFPLRGKLNGGSYEVVEHYLGGGFDQLWFARSTAEPSIRYLVSTTANNGFDLATDSQELMRAAGGLLVPRFVGVFDPEGAGGPRRTTLGYVEEVPAGGPLPLSGADTVGHAFRLGAQVAEKLLCAAADGVLDVGLRPEYVWVATHRSVPTVTGLGGRNRDFFAAAMRRRDLPTARLFTRRYVAPEVTRCDPYDDRSLVLTVAVMVAEWLLGRYPYESGDGAWGYNRLYRGEHVELPADARELVPALRPDPVERPDLATFARILGRLA